MVFLGKCKLKICTVMFDYEERKTYHRLFNVFKASCEAVMPEVKFEAILIQPPKIKEGWSAGMAANVAKLHEWLRVLEESNETVCFSDCDMICLKSVAEADHLDFDLAYTTRRISIPVNGGVVFVKPTEEGRAIMRLWNEIDDRMFADHDFHQKWRKRYAGMNQASFGYILENCSEVAKMLPIPCADWNLCIEDWKHIGANTHMVHIKGKLRKDLLDNQPMTYFPPTLEAIVKLWRAYEAGDKGPEYLPPPPPKREIQNADRASQIFMRRRNPWA